MSELLLRGRDPLRGFRIFRVGLNPERSALYTRIDERAARMFQDGLIEETKDLIAKYGEGARPLTSLGYKQALQFLRGELDGESAVCAAQQAHRNYAKRQVTWFRREPDVHWLAGMGDDPRIQAQAMERIGEAVGANAEV
jgi:tRNA dimethylallyltransferase